MDVDGNNCTCTGKPVKTNIYEITLKKLITDVTCTSSVLTKIGSQATLEAIHPTEAAGTTSSAPLSGKFQVKCV